MNGGFYFAISLLILGIFGFLGLASWSVGETGVTFLFFLLYLIAMVFLYTWYLDKQDGYSYPPSYQGQDQQSWPLLRTPPHAEIVEEELEGPKEPKEGEDHG